MVKKTVIFLVILLCVFSSLFALENSEIRKLLDETTVRIEILDENNAIYSFGSGFFVRKCKNINHSSIA